MSSHTPGPWSIEFRRGGQWEYSPNAIISGGDLSICEIWLRSKAYDVPDEIIAQSEANTALIAAAPELLSALNSIVVCMRTLARPGECEQELNEARAAIYKATGK